MGCGLVVKCFPGMHEVLSAIVSTGSREKHQIQLQCPEIMCVGGSGCPPAVQQG